MIKQQAWEEICKQKIPFRKVEPPPHTGWYCCYDDCLIEFQSYADLHKHQMHNHNREGMYFWSGKFKLKIFGFFLIFHLSCVAGN